MARYELVYFNLKGRVEVPRLLLVDQGISFKDTFVEFSDWPLLKPTVPFGALPVLKINDGERIIPQSLAIARYLAREHALLPTDSWELATCEMYMGQVEDVKDKITYLVYLKYEEYMDQFVSEIPSMLEPFERRLCESGEFLMFSGMSLVDYMLYDMLDTLNKIKPGCLHKIIQLNKFYKAFQERPNIKIYRADEKYKNMRYAGKNI